VSGEAFGVSVNLTAPIALSVPKTPDVVLPPNGGMQQANLLSLSQPGVVSTSVLEVSTEGSIGPHSASAVSQASVDNLNLLNGFITAGIVEAMSTSVSNGTTATSSSAGSGFFNLVVNGTPIAANVPPNTKIVTPVGMVILNEQIFGGDGVHSTSLTVDMIDVTLNGSLGGEIIVSSAHSDVNFTTPGPSPGQGEEHMTGGGRLGSGPGDFATFGFNAGLHNGAPEGQLEYQDHNQSRRLNFHGTSITSFSVDPNNPNCVTFSGIGRLNGVDGYTFTVTACDNGDPGRGQDTFKITIWGPNGYKYSSIDWYMDVITAGNIQEHR
jgi:hypothetical protein